MDYFYFILGFIFFVLGYAAGWWKGFGEGFIKGVQDFRKERLKIEKEQIVKNRERALKASQESWKW